MRERGGGRRRSAEREFAAEGPSLPPGPSRLWPPASEPFTLVQSHPKRSRVSGVEGSEPNLLPDAPRLLKFAMHVGPEHILSPLSRALHC